MIVEDISGAPLAAGLPWRSLLSPDLGATLDTRLKKAARPPFATQIRLFGSAVGCALCVPVEENGEIVGDIALLTVAPPLRRRGLGRDLLKRLEFLAGEQGLPRLRLTWLGNEEGPGLFAPFLAAQGWTAPTAATSRVALSAQALVDLTGDLGFAQPRERFSVVEWGTIGVGRRARLSEALAASYQPPLPDGLDPFAVERVATPDLSVAGLWNDEVVCWLMASWTPPRAALVNVSYGLPDALTARRTVRMWHALAHALVKRTPEAFCWWETPTSYDAMTRIIRHRRNIEGAWVRTGWSASRTLEDHVGRRGGNSEIPSM